jgi:hypothetical protein
MPSPPPADRDDLLRLLIRERFGLVLLGPKKVPAPVAVGPRRLKTGPPWLTDKTIPLPPEHFLIPKLPRARNQGPRGTAVAFTVCSMWELMARQRGWKPVMLSPEYVFYRVKQEDGIPEVGGTYLETGLAVLERYGACRETLCPYGKHVEDFRKPPSNLAACDADARAHRITGSVALPIGDVAAIKRALLSHRPVGIGISIFLSALGSSSTRVTGEMLMPLLSGKKGRGKRLLEELVGSHSVCLVGYRDNNPAQPDSFFPGGGYFAFCNSWGKEWAKQPRQKGAGQREVLPAGYGILPYAYVEKYTGETYVIDDLCSDDAEV